MVVSGAVSSNVGRRIIVAMSGGVDSSVAAYLLKKQRGNFDIEGLYMSNWDPRDEDEQEQYHCNEQDYKDCQSVCNQLQIPLHYASFAKEYWTGVFEPFVEGIFKGQMPNPDVGCNSIIKFGVMKRYANCRLTADYIATGHYARLWHRDGQEKLKDDSSEVPALMETILSQDSALSEWLPTHGGDTSIPLLLAGADLSKDQSYFLSRVSGESFRNVLFPLGDFQKKSNKINETQDSAKKTTRQVAQEAGLTTVSTKRESMGICFVGKRRKFANFIDQYLPSQESTGGEFVNVDTGQGVGHHDGVHQYVIGQGAKIGGASQKWFVVGRDGTSNSILVCGGTHHPALYSNELHVRDLHWIGGHDCVPPRPLVQNKEMRAYCRTRHLQPMIPCTVILQEDALSNDKTIYTIRFDTPVRGITPGQIAALYVGPNGEVCLGGGPIWTRGPTFQELGLDLPQTLHPSGHNDVSVENRL